MEGNKRNFFKKKPNFPFKKKGNNPNKQGKFQNFSHEKASGDSVSAETMYRILCPSKKIGSVIGRGGTIVKALREETHAKITVSESVSGSDERVVIVSSSTKQQNTKDDMAVDGEEKAVMNPHCPAQNALLKVHDRMVEEDLVGDSEVEVVVRLLVPNSTVGCVLGKKGDVIQRLRRETAAGIRVLPSDQLPTCAMSNDELVQISGLPEIVKKALYEVSTLLYKNPRKDKPISGFPRGAQGAQGFHPPGSHMPNMPPPGNPMWPRPPNPTPHGVPPPMPWMGGGYGNQPSGIFPGGSFNGAPPAGPGGEASGEFSLKILCSVKKIGGVIGKGGSNVKLLQHETGASIHVAEASPESEERVIRVSAFEAMWNPRSQSIEAILQLQNKTSEIADDGTITTRLLVPSTKVGCLIGQGGQVINEMRRRTQADIRIFPKEEKPKCASEDEELVQISGSFGVAKDALAEVASRLRARSLRDGNAGVEPGPGGPLHAQGFGHGGSFPGGGPPSSGGFGAGSSSGYDPLKAGGHDMQNYPVLPSGTGYPNVNNSIPHSASNSTEIGGARLKLQNPQSGGSDCVLEIRGSSDHLNAAQTILQAFRASGPNPTPQQAPYQNPNPQHAHYPNPQQAHYLNPNAQQPSYHNPNTQQPGYQNPNPPQHAPYQNVNPQQNPYQNFNPQQQQGLYQHGPYQY